MLKLRVIPTLLLKEVGLVKGSQFNNSRRVGTLLPAIKVYNHREVDELVVLDIAATLHSRPPDFETIASVTSCCLMPLTVGGGITNITHIKKLLQLGVDKITLNSAIYNHPELISEAANIFGSQCIIASIDVKMNSAGIYTCYSHNGIQDQHISAIEWARRVETLGAGEILLTSIERDGTLKGYDLKLIEQVSKAVNIPIIASGGAGSPEDAIAAINSGASAVAAASIFHFTKHTPLSIKLSLAEQGIPVRKANYECVN